ncbi:hypothetical protein ACE6H2_002311 [Prunus campanulata]
MRENDFFPTESSTTDPATPSQPTFTEFAAQMAELMKTQASTSTTTPTPTITYETSSAFHTSYTSDSTCWIIDSGATDHMTFDPTDFLSTTTPQRTSIANANGVTSPVDILTKEIIGRGTKRGGLYYVDDFSMGKAHSVKHSSTWKDRQLWLWHRRLGHPSFGYMRHLFPDLFSSSCTTDFQCDTCILAKSHRASYPLSTNKSVTPFALIHSDVWGPSPISTTSGFRWFITFVDDCTRMTWLFMMKNKTDVFPIFQSFHKQIETQFSTKIQVLRSDNGGEYINHDFQTYFKMHGIIHETTCPQTPQQNGVAERKNRHLLETARALLIGAHVPRHHWDDAIVTSVYLINRMPSKVLDFRTPLQALAQHGPLPSVQMLPPRIFGCVAFVHLHKNQRGKLDPCALRCVFVGYAAHQKGYRCYHPSSRRTYVTLDVTFMESEMFFHDPVSNSLPQRSRGIEAMNKEDLGIQGPEDWKETHPNNEVEIRNMSQATGRNEPSDRSSDSPEAEIQNMSQATGRNEPSDRSPDSPEAENRICPKTTGLQEPSDRSPDSHEAEVRICPETTGRQEPSDRSLSRQKHDISSYFTNETDEDPPHISVPSDQSPENTPEVSDSIPSTALVDEIVRYQLPVRQNRGKPPIRYSPDNGKASKYPIANYVSAEKLSAPLQGFVHQLSAIHIPTKVSEALKDPKWFQAMTEEMHALEKNHTWTLETLPQGKRTVGCRWVYTLKYNADGSIERYKARLVAKGYTQTYGIDYDETFAPVAKLNTVRVLLSIAANLDWPLHQFDVKNAFLHGELTEEVYMDIPPGYVTSTHANVVCRLRKALYGLKQSPRAWFGRFTLAMRNYGFKQSNSDHTLFLKHKGGKVTALIIYVDDMIITGNDTQEISRLQKCLAKEFEMKNLGGLKYFLGIEVARSKQGIFLSQRKYVLDLLAETGMLDCKPVDTPIVQNHHLGEYPNQAPTNKERYQRLVGRLIYLSHTRPDIAYAVSVASQFMHCPSEDHMDAVFRILKYLKSAPGKGLLFTKNGHLNISGYTDADWAGNVTDRRSTSGYFTFVGGNLVTWRSKKQNVVALSSAEAEFRGMTKGICELLWLRKLLTEIGYAPTLGMHLQCDNKAAISIAHNPVQHDRTKHVEVDRHFIRQKLDNKEIQLPFVKSEDQLADILTKAVSSRVFHNSLIKLGIGDIYAPT